MDNKEAIDLILERAFSENGIGRWCSGIRTIKPPKSYEELMLSQAVSRGATLRLHIRDASCNDVALTQKNILTALNKGPGGIQGIKRDLSIEDADELVQMAVFGEIKYRTDKNRSNNRKN